MAVPGGYDGAAGRWIHGRVGVDQAVAEFGRLAGGGVACGCCRCGGEEDGKGCDAAAEALAVLLIQRGAADQARAVLRRLGFQYRLHDDVLRYRICPGRSQAGEPPTAHPPADQFVRAGDNALPAGLLQRVQGLFAPDAAFWSEHGYAVFPPKPYFSYAHRLDQPAPASSVMDVLIDHVRAVAAGWFPDVAAAGVAEWWAHCRPHASGHQLHYDSDDEGRDGLRHPIVSTVVCLSDGGVGGPTLVTTQTLGSRRLASTGWLVHPMRNRLVAFAGDVLHGVMPGRPGDDDAIPPGRRITLMIAFWKSIQVRDEPGDGAARPYPYRPAGSRADHTWPAAMATRQGEAAELAAECDRHRAAPAALTPVAAQPVPVWDDVAPGEQGLPLRQLRHVPPQRLCFHP